MIEAGKLNRRLTIYQAVIARSSTGVETTTWQALATVWAERASLFLREVNRMAGLADAAEAKFVIRYRSSMTFAANEGVTLNQEEGLTRARARYAMVTVIATGTDRLNISGSMRA